MLEFPAYVTLIRLSAYEALTLNPHTNVLPVCIGQNLTFLQDLAQTHCRHEAFSDFPFPHHLREAIFPFSQHL